MKDVKEQQKNVAKIVQKELNETLSNGEVIDFVEILIGCITHNPISWTKLVSILKNHSVSVTQKIPIEQNRCAMACQGCGAAFFFSIIK